MNKLLEEMKEIRGFGRCLYGFKDSHPIYYKRWSASDDTEELEIIAEVEELIANTPEVVLLNKLPAQVEALIGDTSEVVPFDKRLDLDGVPTIALIELAAAMRDGNVKYGRKNYYNDRRNVSNILSAMKRHIAKFELREDYDESGAHHLGHVMGQCAMLLVALQVGTAIDDRMTKGNEETLKRLKELSK